MKQETKDIIEVIYWSICLIVLIVTAFYVANAPVKAVKIGRELNDEQNKFNAKRNLFLMLFAHRGKPIHYNFVNGLNQIDVVFHDTPLVLTAWHNYFSSVHQKDLVNHEEVWSQLRTEILSQMAVSLGYGQLTQLDIMKAYNPQGHENVDWSDWELKTNAIKYLKVGVEIFERMIAKADDEEKKKELPKDNQ